ncbi:peroxidase domain-containing protein [Cephalotus follicularis]|uniref:Peroxidase n=1 Tax=Cephalotus follicularis TaxID=3775 RepID=A0A1Q3C084_CEPFO|nr:peroxidase domain-containing protein [Cephalotus follicularis]
MERNLFLTLLVVALSLLKADVDAAVSLIPPVTLTWHYYRHSCHDGEVYIRHEVKKFWDEDKSITPQLLRLLFSDCFVTGCDASILLDNPNSEKTAPQNQGLGGFIIIDKIKTVLEDRCPGVVSCADILNLATRDAVHLAGAPSYPVFTGRRDGFTSSAASVDIPSPSMSNEAALAYFKSRKLDLLDMTTLLGAHSMGRVHCHYIVDRLYNFNNTGKPDPSMSATIADKLKLQCPPGLKKNQSDPLVFLNPESGSNYKFTDSYYSRVLSHEATLGVDQQLLFNNDTLQIIEEFAAGFEDFRKSFALSISRMGGINVLTGKDGEIRRNCRLTNKDNPHKN